MSSSPEDQAFWRRFRVLMLGVVLCRGLVLLCVLPPFEGWDEYQHVGYVVHVVETGRPAFLGETDAPRSLLAAAVKFPQPKIAVETQIGRLGAVGYATYWAGRSAPTWRPGGIGLYQAQHAWWYYRLVAPLFRALGGVEDLRRSIGGLRLLNLVFTAAAVWIALGALGRIVRQRRDAALIGLVIALQPLLLINGTRVASDALGVLLATAAIAACLTLDGRRIELRCLGIGVLVGLAILAKAVNFGLLPFVAACWLGAVVRERLSPARSVLAALSIAVGGLTVIQSDLRFNLAHFGGLTPMQEAVINRLRGRTSTDLLRVARDVPWSQKIRSLWLTDTFLTGGWSFLRPSRDSRKVYAWALLVGLFGWCWRAVDRGRSSTSPPVFVSPWSPASCVVLVLGFTVALAYHVIQSKLAWGQPTTNPWYACSALPWFLAVVIGGGLTWPLGRWRSTVPLVLAASCLVGESSVVWSRMVPTYSGGASGLEALRRLASLQPAFLGTATLLTAVVGEVLLLAFAAVSSRVPGVKDGS